MKQSAEARARAAARRLAAGVCRNCGCRPAKQGCTGCAVCLHAKNLTQLDTQAERRERGACPGCGGRKGPRGWGCSSCLARRREAQRRLRARRAAAGLCQDCGEQLLEGCTRTCRWCLSRRAESYRRRRRCSGS